MGGRNMLYSGPVLDSELEHAHLRPEPSLVSYSGVTSFAQPNHHPPTLLPPGNGTSYDPHHLPENHGLIPYGITPYNSVDRHHPAIPSPSAGVFTVPINHGFHDQFPFSGSFERNNGHFTDGFYGVFKRKNVEGIPGNFQYFYPAPGSSSSVAGPMTTEGTMADAPPFVVPEYRGSNDMPMAVEPGLQTSARNRGAGAVGLDRVMTHNNSHLAPGNYGAQPLQAVPGPWFDQQFRANGNAAGTFSWNRPPAMPYAQGGGMEPVNMRPPGYQVTALNRNSAAFVHPPPITPHHVPHNIYHPPPPLPSMAPLQGQNMDFHSQQASTSHRPSTNSAVPYPTATPFQNGRELGLGPGPGPGPRFVGSSPPTGVRVYRPHQRELMVESTARHHNFPHFRVLPEDGVAILDISGYREAAHSVDHHRDMRLDIDHMSYEELLALSEQIGSVGSGLSDDFILEHLKTRTFASSKSEDACPANQELNFCVICQADYNDEEKIGVVDCGHEYHVECIKKWLTMKNSCPICKSTALAATQAKES